LIPTHAVDALLLQLPLSAVVAALAVLGAIWGSFAAALCSRWPNGEGVVSGRSRCDHCHKTLGVAELVPIVSYLLQRGRCRHCQASIGQETFITELVCAALGAASALLLPGASGVAAALFCWLIVPLAILDWLHLWLPDPLILLLAVGGLLFGEMLAGTELLHRLIGCLAGWFVLEALRIGFAKLRGVEGMGKGDPKLLGAIGLWLGWALLPTTVLLASAIGLGHYLVGSKAGSDRNTAFPLGSYLAIGATLVPFGLALAT
jgi:leader peptidase (prepilin peptidase) / N-methyltransferase